MKKLSSFFTIVISVITLNSYAQQTQTVSDEGGRYSIEIPSGWVHVTSKNAFVSVLMCSDTVHVGERLNIVDSKNTYNLEKANKVNKDALSDFKNFKVVQEGDGSLGGQPCKWFLYTFNSDEGNIPMKGKYYTVKNSGRGYSFHYILAENRYDSAKDTFEKIISTVKFK